jgi:thioredoxin-related protein
MQKAFSFIISAGFIFFISSAVQAQSSTREKKEPKVEKIKWYSFEDAFQLNKKKQKKIFIDVYTDWCGWCKKMDADTFTDPVIAEFMNDHFYCVKLNAERRDTVIIDGVTFTNANPENKRGTHQLAVELLKGKMSYPSYVFLNEKSQWLTVVPGYQPPKEFESVIHYFGDDAYQKTPWEEYKAAFVGEIK